MDAINIYQFTDYAEFLRLACDMWAARRQRSMTLTDWAQRLGYRSPRSLAMVLNGQRLPSAPMVVKLADNLLNDPGERRYFTLLVELAKRREAQRPAKDVLAELEALNPGISTMTPVDAATFAYIAEWYHLVLKQLIGSPSFREDVDWIRQRLRGKVTAAEVKQALAVMERLQIVTRADGKLAAGGSLKTTTDVPSAAIKLHHQQMLERAAEASREQDVGERELTSATLRMRSERIAEAKAWIRRFRDEFHHHFEDATADAVFQLNVQCFNHTQETN